MHIHIFITQRFFYLLFINLKAFFLLLFIFENKINIHSYIYLLWYERKK